MKATLTKSNFRDGFRDCNRQDQFSYEALGALYDYLVDYEDSCDTELEFNPIAFCCEFTEYADATEAASEYFEFEGMAFDDNGAELETAEDVEKKALKFLEDRAIVIEFNKGVIIQNF